jgi:hypothetical protein
VFHWQCCQNVITWLGLDHWTAVRVNVLLTGLCTATVDCGPSTAIRTPLAKWPWAWCSGSVYVFNYLSLFFEVIALLLLLPVQTFVLSRLFCSGMVVLLR